MSHVTLAQGAFDVVPISAAGVAEEVAGDVRILWRSEGWIPLLRGTEVGDGTKLQFGVGARLGMRFASGERAELKSPDKETLGCVRIGSTALRMSSNNRVEHAHSVRSTRKGEAPLLAAHAGR